MEGNGETLYFFLDEKDNSFMGMNKMICSDIMIRFKDGKVNTLTALKRPEANFIPPHELTKDVLKLKGFEWKEQDRPVREDVVKKKVPAANPSGR